MNWALAAGSLAAVLMLAGIAWGLKLGGPGRIDGADQAARLAEDAIAGFDATDAVVGADGLGAVVFGAEGSVALIRPSGARFLVREVRRPRWRLWDDPGHAGLDIDTGDRAPVRLWIEGGKPAAQALAARLDAATDNDVNSVRA